MPTYYCSVKLMSNFHEAIHAHAPDCKAHGTRQEVCPTLATLLKAGPEKQPASDDSAVAELARLKEVMKECIECLEGTNEYRALELLRMEVA